MLREGASYSSEPDPIVRHCAHRHVLCCVLEGPRHPHQVRATVTKPE